MILILPISNEGGPAGGGRGEEKRKEGQRKATYAVYRLQECIRVTEKLLQIIREVAGLRVVIATEEGQVLEVDARLTEVQAGENDDAEPLGTNDTVAHVNWRPEVKGVEDRVGRRARRRGQVVGAEELLVDTEDEV